jgi:hypothetical protein
MGSVSPPFVLKPPYFARVLTDEAASKGSSGAIAMTANEELEVIQTRIAKWEKD